MVVAKPLEVKHAYALIPDPERPGKFYSVHLEGVMYEKLTHLERSHRSESIGFARARIETAIGNRCERGRDQWK